MTSTRGSYKNQNNQYGFVAIFSTLMIMGILTLLTIGFSSVMRQSQKRALDDHLSNQAFYAAESGINMARGLGSLEEKDDCGPDSQFADDDYAIDADNNIGISCLLVDPNPTTLQFDVAQVPITTYVSTVSGINSFDISFSPDNSCTPNCARDTSNPELLSAADWGDRVGILRVDLVPNSDEHEPDDFTDRGWAVENSYTFYLYPTTELNNNSHAVLPGYSGQGAMLLTTCNTSGECHASISLDVNSYSNYYIRLSAYYNPISTTLAPKDVDGASLETSESQVVIDSTGRANDVYRRLQVRVPTGRSRQLSSNLGLPFALLSSDICKRYVFFAPDGSDFGDVSEDRGDGTPCGIPGRP